MLLMNSLSGAVAFAAQQRDDAEVEKVRIKVAKQGLGDKARVTVRMKDGTKVKGFISQAGTDEFTVRDRKTGQPTLIRYNDVAKVENNRGHSTLRNILIGVGIGVGAFLALIAITIANDDS
jgi:hypothetical protein